jgi:hypothetical protein
MPTVTASYAKIKADTPFVAHSTNGGLCRILKTSEHADVRSITGDFKVALLPVVSVNIT